MFISGRADLAVGKDAGGFRTRTGYVLEVIDPSFPIQFLKCCVKEQHRVLFPSASSPIRPLPLFLRGLSELHPLGSVFHRLLQVRKITLTPKWNVM